MKVLRVASTHLESISFLDNDPITESGYQYDPEDDTTDAEDLFEAAGRGCYQSFNRPNPATAKNIDYLHHILEVGHTSIFEHASVTYYVEGVSRALLLELERHRHISFSVVSQRYVDSSDAVKFPFVDHPVLRDLSPELKVDVALRVAQGRLLYGEMVKDLQDKGYSRKEARGAARNVLEEGTTTRFLVTGNVRAWRGIIQQRYSSAADAEIREFARLVLEDLLEYCPNAVQDFERVEVS